MLDTKGCSTSISHSSIITQLFGIDTATRPFFSVHTHPTPLFYTTIHHALHHNCRGPPPGCHLGRPASKPNNDEQCKPVSYILTEYTIAKSPSYYFISFNVQSSYTSDTLADDRVRTGANCEADGTEIHPRGNLCNIAGKRVDNLKFDLREESGYGAYRMHHKWQCNGATWASVTDIDFLDLDCKPDDGESYESVKCTSKPIILRPQKVRKISDEDKKKIADKTKIAKPAQPSDKPADCHECKPSTSL